MPLAPSTPGRRLVAGLWVMVGAVPVYLVANSSFGRPPNMYGVLVAVGIVGIVGWLIDGDHYLGASAAALAVGGGIAISREAFVDEYFTVFGLMAVALMCVVRINPRAVNGCAGLLLYVAASTGKLHDPDLLPRGLAFAVVMLIWGSAGVRRARKASTTA